MCFHKFTFSLVRDTVITRLIAAPKALKSCSIAKKGSKSTPSNTFCGKLDVPPTPRLNDTCDEGVLESAILLKMDTLLIIITMLQY